MLYIKNFTTENDALFVSALGYNAAIPPEVREVDDPTQYLYPVIKHPSREEWAIKADESVWNIHPSTIDHIKEGKPDPDMDKVYSSEEKEKAYNHLINKKSFTVNAIAPSSKTVLNESEAFIDQWFSKDWNELSIKEMSSSLFPSISPSLAETIKEERDNNGDFESLEDLKSRVSDVTQEIKEEIAEVENVDI